MMDYTKLFYWLTVADNTRGFFKVMVVIFTAIVVISTIANIITSDEEIDGQGRILSRQWMWRSYPFFLLFWLLLIFTPSKKDTLLIVAGGQTLNFLSTDESTRQIPKELSSFVLNELKTMVNEAKVELGISNQKEKLLEKAKSMTTEELIEELKSNNELKELLLKE